MTDVNAWSTVADSNNTVSPDGFPEGNMQFSGVNDSWREVMAAEAKLWKDTNGSLVATGSANNYSVQLNSGYTSYFIGMTFACSIPAANTDTSGIVYLTVATTVGGGSYGLGSKQIIYDDLNADYVYNVLGASRFLLPHALTTGKIYRFCYDGTCDCWMCRTIAPCSSSLRAATPPLRSAIAAAICTRTKAAAIRSRGPFPTTARCRFRSARASTSSTSIRERKRSTCPAATRWPARPAWSAR
jgi:hypothetical protein